jgi:heme oxygenase (biliverdin-producing, ferredoxin)
MLLVNALMYSCDVQVAQRSAPAFVCHFYNHYFAHTAGGLMIGRKVSDMCLDGKKLQFYQWGEGADVKALLEKVRIKVSITAL